MGSDGVVRWTARRDREKRDGRALLIGLEDSSMAITETNESCLWNRGTARGWYRTERPADPRYEQQPMNKRAERIPVHLAVCWYGITESGQLEHDQGLPAIWLQGSRHTRAFTNANHPNVRPPGLKCFISLWTGTVSGGRVDIWVDVSLSMRREGSRWGRSSLKGEAEGRGKAERQLIIALRTLSTRRQWYVVDSNRKCYCGQNLIAALLCLWKTNWSWEAYTFLLEPWNSTAVTLG